MSKKIKIIIYIVLYALFGFWVIKSVPKSDYYLYYTIALFLNVGLLFTLTRYCTTKQWRGNQLLPYLIMVAGLAFSYVTSAYFYRAYLGDVMGGHKIPLLKPLVLKDVLPFLLLAVIIALVPSINFRKPVVKKTALYLGVVVVMVLAGFLIKYVIDVRYKGNESIHFMGDHFHTLDDIIKKEQFEGKVVYIDLWFSSCGPCIQEFKKLPALKEQLKKLDVEYLYLARETSHPNSEQLWKNAVKKYNLQGWHVYMTDELKKNIWDVITHKTGAPQAYPHYLLVNRSNVVVSYDASSPSEKEKMVQEIKSLTGTD